MKEQAKGVRTDVTGVAVRQAAIVLGWEERPEPDGWAGPRPVVAVAKAGPAATLVAELARLVEVGAASDWWLARLSVSELASRQAAVSLAFSGGRRVVTSRASAAAVARRRVTGGRLGRPPSIGPELLGRIAEARNGGRSYRGIAADLEADAVPTPGGARQWYASTVRAAHLRLLASD